MNTRLIAVLLCVAGTSGLFAATNEELKAESFDRDPGWEGWNNHVAPKRVPTVIQDFGYSPTHMAGKESGEIGGRVWRSSTQASYAGQISPKTLSDKLSASGTFAITATSGSSGVFLGWFNAQDTDGRQSSLGLRLAGQGGGARLTLQLVTAKNQACGTKITPWVVDKSKPKGAGRKYRPTSIKNDGTRYQWTLEYEPEANEGNGRIQFAIRSDGSETEEFERKVFTVALPKGYKEQGTTFNRFGLRNGEKGGNSMTIYFGDLVMNGQREDFSKDPGWAGSGNRTRFEDRVQGGTHDYGFMPETTHAGGKAGEIGGTFWRSGAYGYYADRIGPLSLNERLEARGKVVLLRAPPDSGMYFGWFNSADRTNAPTQAGNFVGIKIGGPTHAGHYFVPAYATARSAQEQNREPGRKRISIESKQGPLLVPKRVLEWKVIYDPNSNSGKGAIEATLGEETIKLPLRNGDKSRGATFDRFGFFTSHIGGSFVEVYLDDLQYTAQAPHMRSGSLLQ